MYNRYIPQSDGSFRRSQMPDRSRPAPHPEERPSPPPAPPCPPPEQEAAPPCKEHEPKPQNPGRCPRQGCCPPPRQKPRPTRQDSCQEHSDGGIGSFLRNLLPKDFDTADLLVVILLLLMAGDCHEDQNSALLTLALYLFM